MANIQPSSLPPAFWLHCPRKSSGLLLNKFLVFKTPLSEGFDRQVPEECRFTTEMLFGSMKSQNLKMGLWIDLTSTSQFYNWKEVEAHGCRYLKFPKFEPAEKPTLQQIQLFINVCRDFMANNPLEIIGIHSTHGFNRAGFFVASFLIENEGFDLATALAAFASVRSPGIYENDFIRELHSRFSSMKKLPPSPPKPEWCSEYCHGQFDNEKSDSKRPLKQRKMESSDQNFKFMAGVLDGVKPLVDTTKIEIIQERVRQICSWTGAGFPGSQPVSMDRSNITLLGQKPYRVSWKADGTRYLLFIQTNGEVYLIDRDNNIFQVSGLSFPYHRDLSYFIQDTLLDGEMVIDVVDGANCPRYLAYDIIMYDSKDVSKQPFWPERYGCIQKIVRGRRLAHAGDVQRKNKEPFSVREKQFWPLTYTAKLLDQNFLKQLSHEAGGLIFQPCQEAYIPGQARNVLKWKPASRNSVDFKLKIVVPTGLGIVPKNVGQLFVADRTDPFSFISTTQAVQDLDGKIVECYQGENHEWILIRERTDKSFPNSYDTARAICESISHPVTKKYLFNFIDNQRF